MPIFPLDAVRNAAVERRLEPALEELRLQIARFDFPDTIGGAEAVLEAYDYARPRLNLLTAILERVPNGTGADISTGIGFLPVLLQQRGLHLVATERDPAIAGFALANGIDVRIYDIGSDPPPIPPGTLDFVIFAEVLEHLKLSPVPVIRQISSMLRPGGLFLLTTPNIGRLRHIEALAAGESFLEQFPSDLPLSADATDYVEHVREYSVREVVAAVEDAGVGIDQVLMTGWGDSGYHPLANPFANDIIVVIAQK